MMPGSVRRAEHRGRTLQITFDFVGSRDWFTRAHPLDFTTKRTKDTKLKNGIKRFVL